MKRIKRHEYNQEILLSPELFEVSWWSTKRKLGARWHIGSNFSLYSPQGLGPHSGNSDATCFYCGTYTEFMINKQKLEKQIRLKRIPPLNAIDLDLFDEWNGLIIFDGYYKCPRCNNVKGQKPDLLVESVSSFFKQLERTHDVPKNLQQEILESAKWQTEEFLIYSA